MKSGSPGRKNGGRPCKLTLDTALTLFVALTDGESRSGAARIAGLAPSTLYAWVAAGRAGDPRFARLADCVQRAESERLFWGLSQSDFLEFVP